MSKRIEETSDIQSKLFGVVPYIDPKSFDGYKLDKKSDVYSVGVLLWEISSGYPPFYTEGKPYNVGLAVKILQGLRETIVSDTPDDYAKLYIGKYIYINILFCKYYFFLFNNLYILRLLGR